MRIQLQCKRGNEPWSILNTAVYAGNDAERRMIDRHMDMLQQRWSYYFYDHEFRIIKPRVH